MITRWYYSKKCQGNKAQLAECRRIDASSTKLRTTPRELWRLVRSRFSAVEIERRRAVLGLAIRAREQDEAQHRSLVAKVVDPEGPPWRRPRGSGILSGKDAGGGGKG